MSLHKVLELYYRVSHCVPSELVVSLVLKKKRVGRFCIQCQQAGSCCPYNTQIVPPKLLLWSLSTLFLYLLYQTEFKKSKIV